MKKFLVTLVFFAALFQVHATDYKLYFWINAPKKIKYSNGLKVSINGVERGRLYVHDLALFHMKNGDQVYKIELFDNEHSLGTVAIDKPTDSLTYYKIEIAADGYNRTIKGEKQEPLAAGLFVMNKNNYHRRLEVYEENEEESNTSSQSLSYGSGFLVSPDGYIVTNNHVVDGHKSIKIKGIEGDFTTEYEADIVGKDVTNDLVLLKLKSKTVKFSTMPYTLKTQMANTGEEISILGYPLGPALGDEIKLTTGVISAKSGYGGDVTTYQISAAVQHGNSGGPVFDSHGNIVGVVVAKIMKAENIAYAIKAIYLQALLGMLPTEAQMTTVNTIADKTLPEKVAAESKFVYIIKCE